MKKILVVADVQNWAFDKIYKNLNKFSKKFNYIPSYTDKNDNGYKLKDHEQFDLILYLCDYCPDELIESNIPKEKVVMAIRSMVKNDFYQDKELMQNTTSALLVSNRLLFDRFKNLHPNVVLAPGGVDTQLFRPANHQYPLHLQRKPVVGWAGSHLNMGINDFRGLGLIKEACKKVGYAFKPALREERWRTEQEMLVYYQDEIDIYIDLSKTAGRQNGLLEAGACAKPVIANKVGVTEQLINNGYNGYIVKRELKDVTLALTHILPNATLFGKRISREINDNWSWETHLKPFENVFEIAFNGQ